MTEKMYEELAMEEAIKNRFGVDAEMMQPIVYRVPVSRTAEATLFLNSKKQLYLYVTGESKLLLSDIKKTVAKMNLKAESYVTPKGQPNYFDDVGREKFKKIFPGRSNISDQDIIYYKTLTPYNPALVMINDVIGGEVYQFDSDSSQGWRLATRFSYRRLRTS